MKKKIISMSSFMIMLLISLSGISQNRVWPYYGPMIDSDCINSGVSTVEKGAGSTIYRGGYCDNTAYVSKQGTIYTVDPTNLEDRIYDLLYIGSNKVIATGYGYSPSNRQDIGFIFEIDMSTGVINWIYTSNNTSNHRVRFYSIHQGANNTYVVTGTNHTTSNNYSTDGLICIFDLNGNILNQKNYHSSASDDFNGSVLKDNTLYVASRMFTLSYSVPAISAFNIDFNTYTITPDWSNFYLKTSSNSNLRLYGNDIALNDGKLELMVTGDLNGSSISKSYLVQTDLSGNPLISTELTVPGYDKFIAKEIRKELDRIMILGQVEKGNKKFMCIMYLSSNHSLLYGFKIINGGTDSDFPWNADGQIIADAGNQMYFSGRQDIAGVKNPIDIDIDFNNYVHTNTNCLINYNVKITNLDTPSTSFNYTVINKNLTMNAPNIQSTKYYYDVYNCNSGCSLEINSISSTQISCDQIRFNASITGSGSYSYYWTAKSGTQFLTSTSSSPTFTFTDECALYTICLALTSDDGSTVCSDMICINYQFTNCNELCDAISDPTGERIKSSTPTEELSLMNIFPNPANDVVNINLPDINYSAVISFRNIAGQLVYQTTSTTANNQFDMSQFETGIYIIEVNVNGQIQREKLIVK